MLILHNFFFFFFFKKKRQNQKNKKFQNTLTIYFYHINKLLQGIYIFTKQHLLDSNPGLQIHNQLLKKTPQLHYSLQILGYLMGDFLTNLELTFGKELLKTVSRTLGLLLQPVLSEFEEPNMLKPSRAKGFRSS